MKDSYTATIGLEIHAELKTNTKMFCSCKNSSDEKRPNQNICPICMAHPGTLPVINAEAVKHVIKVGRAVGGEIADFTEFDRKNYFYPDIPKGYQISQYKYPIVTGGKINGIKITRVHLEEDTARSTHDKGDDSLIDYNRAGVPLMELVTEPVIKNSVQASSFAKELQLLLRYLGASDANMEKGEMRVEANISVSKDKNFGTKVEVKNLNSFKVVEKAIQYEIERHIEVLNGGGKIVQETRGWDDKKQETFSQRVKESSHDYRYFPDPDLPKLKLSELEDIKKEKLPELPWDKRVRYLEFGIKSEDAEMYVRSDVYGKFFDSILLKLGSDKEMVQIASNFISSDLAGMNKNESIEIKIEPEFMINLIKMYKENTISSRGAKDILSIMYKDGGNPEKIAEERGLIQKSDTESLKKIVQKIIKDNSKVVSEYKSGKESSLQFLIGQGMKESKGSANPKVLMEVFKEILSK